MLNAQLLERNFSKSRLTNARAYVRAHKVKSFQHDDVNKQVTGKVHGTRLYTTRIAYGVRRIDGHCSCPVGRNCKHVAALLLAALAEKAEGAEPVATLPRVLEDWVDQITKAPMPAKKQIFYVLAQKQEGQIPTITPVEVTVLKNGSFGVSKPLHGANIAYAGADNLMTHTAISTLLQGSVDFSRRYDFELTPEGYTGACALERIMQESKCFYNTVEGEVITLGEPCSVDFTWQPDDQGDYKLTPSVSGYIFFKTDPVWYYQASTKTVGLVSSAWDPKILNQFLRAPAIPITHLNAVAKRLGALVHFPAPPTFETKIKRKVQPVPILRLQQKNVDCQFNGTSSEKSVYMKTLLLGVPSLRYGPVEVPMFWKTNKAVHVVENNVLVQYVRDKKAERDALPALFEVLPEITQNSQFLGVAPRNLMVSGTAVEGQKNAWYDWIVNGLPLLEKQGWVLEGQDILGGEMILAAPGEDYFELQEENDWFSAELGVMIQDEKVNLLPVLIQILKNQKDILKTLEARIAQEDDKPFYVRLEGNKILGLPIERAHLFFTFLQDLYNKPLNEEGKLELSKNELAYLALLGDAKKNASLRWMGQTQFLEAAKQLCAVQSIPQLPAPEALQATLRPYQQEGFNWMHFLQTQALSGILADDMGLGKTIQTLAYILQQKQMGQLTAPVLIVAPTSLMVNWAQEIEKFSPSVSFVISHGKDRSQTFDKIETVDVVLTTYPLLYRDRAVLEPKMFHTIILDEAQVIKNAKAQTTLIVQNLKAKQRFCLSGTPLENHLGELWSLFHFLMPGFLGNDTEFKRNYRTPIEKKGDQGVKSLLLRRIKPFILRRTKEQVVLELPPKTEIILRSVMDKKQRDLYETIRVSMHEKVQKEIAQQGFARSQIVILDALLKLRQVCCDPRLLKSESAHTAGSAKLEQLMQILGDMIEEGRKILLFSQFTSMLALIEAACSKAGIPYVLLTGQTQDRKTPVERFQRGEVPLFLISLKAGGTGLNLTQADTVIHYDPWWNPAVERQATDRAHRIGQTKSVFVYKLITEGTVEEKIVALQARKGALAAAILEGNATKETLFTEADIQALFMEPATLNS